MSTLEYALGINEFKEEKLIISSCNLERCQEKQATQQKMKKNEEIMLQKLVGGNLEQMPWSDYVAGSSAPSFRLLLPMIFS